MAKIHPDLFELLRGYSAHVSSQLLTFPSKLRIEDVHNFLLHNILLDNHLATYPTSRRYQHSFWKWAIHNLEENAEKELEDVEIDTRIYDNYVSLLPPPHLSTMPPPSSYISHFWCPGPVPSNGCQDMVDLTSHRTVTVLESRTTIENGTTGLRTWPASFVLSQYLISHPEIVAHKRILELGCGTGFLGIIVASLQQLAVGSHGRHSIWLTDINEQVLARCRDNIQLSCNLSSSHPSITCCLLDWAHAIDPAAMPNIRRILQNDIDAELVLGADLVFDPSLAPALVGVLCMALQASPRSARKVAIIALTLRNEDTFSNFLQTADQVLAVEHLRPQTTLGGDMLFSTLEGGSDVTSRVKIMRLRLKEDGGEIHDIST